MDVARNLSNAGLPAPSEAPEDRLQHALSGDGTAWRELVEEYSGLVFRVALGAGLGREDAEDVTQAVWIALLDGGHRIRDPRALPAWLATASRRIAIRHRGKLRPMQEIPFDLASPEPSVVERLEEEQEFRRIRAALTRLPDRCREVLMALFRERKPDYASIAHRFGIPVGSIGPTRARCLARLHRLLDTARDAR